MKEINYRCDICLERVGETNVNYVHICNECIDKAQGLKQYKFNKTVKIIMITVMITILVEIIVMVALKLA